MLKAKGTQVNQRVLTKAMEAATDDLLSSQGLPAAAEAKRELAGLAPELVQQILEIDKELLRRRDERQRRMDAYGIFPPEYNELRVRSMLRVEHRRAVQTRIASNGAATTSGPSKERLKELSQPKVPAVAGRPVSGRRGGRLPSPDTQRRQMPQVDPRETLLGRLEVLLEDIAQIDAPLEEVLSQPFPGLKKTKVLNIDMLMAALEAQKAEHAQDDVFLEHSGDEPGATKRAPSPPRDSTSTAVGVTDRRRQERLDALAHDRLDEYRDRREDALVEFIKSLDLGLGSDDFTEGMGLRAIVQKAIEAQDRK